MKLIVQQNQRNPFDVTLQLPSGATLLLTAPLITERYLFQVPLSKRFTLAAVPEFGGTAVCLFEGGACRGSLPYESSARAIAERLQPLALSVPRKRLSEAIALLQESVLAWRHAGV